MPLGKPRVSKGVISSRPRLRCSRLIVYGLWLLCIWNISPQNNIRSYHSGCKNLIYRLTPRFTSCFLPVSHTVGMEVQYMQMFSKGTLSPNPQLGLMGIIFLLWYQISEYSHLPNRSAGWDSRRFPSYYWVLPDVRAIPVSHQGGEQGTGEKAINQQCGVEGQSSDQCIPSIPSIPSGANFVS